MPVENRIAPPAPAAPSASPGRRRRWFIAGAAVLAAAAVVAAACWWSAKKKAALPVRFAVVAKGELYRSGQPTVRQLETLLGTHPIGAVISLCKDDHPADVPVIKAEADFLASRGIVFRRLPTDTPPSPEQVRAFLAAIDDPALPRPVLVHCEAGRTRTGAMVAIWRVTHQGWTKERALQDARRYGFKDAATVEVVRNY
jgi:protein tyrosine/serine phosphatase